MIPFGKIIASIVIAVILYHVLKEFDIVSNFAAVTSLDGYTTVQGADFPSNDIKSMKPTSTDACKKECDANTACVGFTMEDNTGTCWLKKAKSEISSSSTKVWYDKLPSSLKSDWADATDGALPLPQVLVDANVATYSTNPDLRNLILARLRDITTKFTEWLKYFKDANAAKRADVTYEFGKRMMAARIIMFGHNSVAIPNGTRTSRLNIVPPIDKVSGLTRITYGGKTYGFTLDQLVPYSTLTTYVTGTSPAESVDNAISNMLYMTKPEGKNRGVIEPVRCDVVNDPLKATTVEKAQCDTTKLYSLYNQMETEFNTYMQRVKGNTSGVGSDMTSSWCNVVNGALWGTTVGDEVMMCPTTHARFSTNADKCVKNGVSYNGGKYSNCTSCRTGYRRGSGCDCVLNEDSTRTPCAKYYTGTVLTGNFMTPDLTMTDAKSWSPLGATPTTVKGGIMFPGTKIPIWGRA